MLKIMKEAKNPPLRVIYLFLLCYEKREQSKNTEDFIFLTTLSHICFIIFNMTHKHVNHEPEFVLKGGATSKSKIK